MRVLRLSLGALLPPMLGAFGLVLWHCVLENRGVGTLLVLLILAVPLAFLGAGIPSIVFSVVMELAGAFTLGRGRPVYASGGVLLLLGALLGAVSGLIAFDASLSPSDSKAQSQLIMILTVGACVGVLMGVMLVKLWLISPDRREPV